MYKKCPEKFDYRIVGFLCGSNMLYFFSKILKSMFTNIIVNPKILNTFNN